MIKLSKVLDDKQQQQQTNKDEQGNKFDQWRYTPWEKETAKNYSARDGRVLEPHSVTRMH